MVLHSRLCSYMCNVSIQTIQPLSRRLCTCDPGDDLHEGIQTNTAAFEVQNVETH